MEKDNFYKNIIYNYKNNIPVCNKELYIDKNNYLSYEEIKYFEQKEFDSKVQTEVDIIDGQELFFHRKRIIHSKLLKVVL